MKKLTFVIICLLLAAPCAANTLIVSLEFPEFYDNIQAAIDDAQNDGDLIVVFPGTYTGPGNRDIYIRKNITIQSVAPELPEIVAATIIDCNNKGRGFYFDTSDLRDSVLDGLTIINGFADKGAGIYCYWNNPTIKNCVITGNTAVYGGGIYCNATRPTVINCVITGNTASDSGGGMYNYCSAARLTNSVICGNKAGNDGGGIYVRDSLLMMVSGCTISGNHAVSGTGGGMYHNGYGNVRVINCILWGNTDSSGTGQSAQAYDHDEIDCAYSCIQDDDPCDANIPFNEDNNYNIDDDPLFVRNPDDGGDGWGVGDNDDFGDLHLQKASPCINAGGPNLLAKPNNLDMDGEPRIIGFCTDMGADEFSPMVVVNKPEANDLWAAGSLHKIEWSAYGIGNIVDISYSTNGGANWQTIENDVVDNESYLWQLPAAVDSGQCLVSVVPSVGAAETVSIESETFSINSYTPHPAVPAKWKSLGGDFRRTGLSENYGPEVGCVKWSFETAGPVSASVTIGAGDRVHIACEDGKLYTLDADGSLVWSYDVNSPLLSSPTISANGTLYVGSRDGKLYAISVGGSLLWTHATYGVVYSSVAVSEDDRVYACSEDGVLYALDHDGSELWTFETDGIGLSSGGSIFASPAIGADGTVYIGGLYDANLYALDPNDGSVKWACGFKSNEILFPPISPTEGWPFASPVVGDDSTIYQTLLYDPNLYAIDANDGNIIWATTLGDIEYDWHGYVHPVPGCIYGLSEPAVGPDGTIYVSFDDPNLRAVNPDGSIKWETRLGMAGGFTLTVGSDGLIYAACDDNYVYVVDADGEVVAQFSGDGWLSFPVIAADNTIIVSDVNNTVWAIEAGACEDGLDMHRPQDLNADRAVNYVDFALLAAHWLQCSDEDDELYLKGDINHDLYVDFADVAALAGRWLNID